MQSINHPTITTNGVIRPAHVEVDLQRLTANFRAIQEKVAPAQVMPILKANAYGHGLVEVAKHMETLGADYLVRAVSVPVGYGDGYFRSMSGKAHVLVRGKKYPVVGRVAMDQIVVHIEWDSAYNDDEVILIGEMGRKQSASKIWPLGPARSPTKS